MDFATIVVSFSGGSTMHWLQNKVPPVILVLLFGLIIWVIAIATIQVPVEQGTRLILALGLLGLGVFFCVSGVVSFRRAKTTVNPLSPGSASSLVSSGIYRYSRNPMYVGFALMLLAWAAYLFAPVSIIGVAGFMVYMNKFQIEPEENALRELFGQEFSEYAQRVRRWL